MVTVIESVVSLSQATVSDCVASRFHLITVIRLCCPEVSFDHSDPTVFSPSIGYGLLMMHISLGCYELGPWLRLYFICVIVAPNSFF